MTNAHHASPQHPAVPPEPLQPPNRIKGFDGLRALAVTMVIVMHKTTWGEHAQIGFYGVWLFFLLSGFLITGQLAAARQRIESSGATIGSELINFWTRRIFRIFPAYYVLIGLTIVAYLVRGKSLEDAGIWWHLLYLTNIYFQHIQTETSNSFMHFWSLSVEEQFYLLFAPLVLLVARRHTLSICVGLFALSLVVRMVLVGMGFREFRIYIDSFVNFGLLALGGILLLNHKRLSRLTKRLHLGGESVPWALLAAFFASIALLSLANGARAELRQLMFVGALLIGAALVYTVYVGQTTVFTRMMEWRPWAHYGKLSYGFYLYQTYPPADLPTWMLVMLARRFPSLEPLAAQLVTASGAWVALMDMLGFIVCFAITMALAQISWTLIEKPALLLRDRLFASKLAELHGPTGAPPLNPTRASVSAPQGRH